MTVLLNSLVKIVSKILVYIHRYVLLSTLVKETSYCSGQLVMQILITCQCDEKWCCVLCQINVTFISLSLRLREHPRRRGWKNIRAGRWGGMLWNAAFWAWHVCYAHEIKFWLPKCEGHMIKTINILLWTWEELTSLLP